LLKYYEREVREMARMSFFTFRRAIAKIRAALRIDPNLDKARGYLAALLPE
jgi:hypothetical protein